MKSGKHIILFLLVLLYSCHCRRQENDKKKDRALEGKVIIFESKLLEITYSKDSIELNVQIVFSNQSKNRIPNLKLFIEESHETVETKKYVVWQDELASEQEVNFNQKLVIPKQMLNKFTIMVSLFARDSLITNATLNLPNSIKKGLNFNHITEKWSNLSDSSAKMYTDKVIQLNIPLQLPYNGDIDSIKVCGIYYEPVTNDINSKPEKYTGIIYLYREKKESMNLYLSNFVPKETDLLKMKFTFEFCDSEPFKIIVFHSFPIDKRYRK